MNKLIVYKCDGYVNSAINFLGGNFQSVGCLGVLFLSPT